MRSIIVVIAARGIYLYGYGSVLARPSVANLSSLVRRRPYDTGWRYRPGRCSADVRARCGLALSGNWSLACRQLSFVSPVIAVALGALFFSERVTVYDVIGIIVMLSGAYLAVAETPATKPAMMEPETRPWRE